MSLMDTCLKCRAEGTKNLHSFHTTFSAGSSKDFFDPIYYGNISYPEDPIVGVIHSGEKPKVHNTTLDVKAQFYKMFSDLVGNQFNHGGDKYKLQGMEDREATDVISSVFGGPTEFDWILGTMAKYIFRFKNFQREKDLLKIATYCYILWLKKGCHLNQAHDEDTSK